MSCYSSEMALKPTEMSPHNDGKVLCLYHNSSEETIEFFFFFVNNKPNCKGTIKYRAGLSKSVSM